MENQYQYIDEGEKIAPEKHQVCKKGSEEEELTTSIPSKCDKSEKEIDDLKRLIQEQQKALQIMSSRIYHLTNKIERMEAKEAHSSTFQVETSTATESVGKFVRNPKLEIFEKLSAPPKTHTNPISAEKILKNTDGVTRTHNLYCSSPVSKKFLNDPLEGTSPIIETATLPKYPVGTDRNRHLLSDPFLTEAFETPHLGLDIERKDTTPGMYDPRKQNVRLIPTPSDPIKPPILETLSSKAYESFMSKFKAYESRGGRRPIYACISDRIAQKRSSHASSSLGEIYPQVRSWYELQTAILEKIRPLLHGNSLIEKGEDWDSLTQEGKKERILSTAASNIKLSSVYVIRTVNDCISLLNTEVNRTRFRYIVTRCTNPRNPLKIEHYSHGRNGELPPEDSAMAGISIGSAISSTISNEDLDGEIRRSPHFL
ncbi:hypothetical protein ADUPG1_008876, partial [Aduncisulcus paluster]